MELGWFVCQILGPVLYIKDWYLLEYYVGTLLQSEHLFSEWLNNGSELSLINGMLNLYGCVSKYGCKVVNDNGGGNGGIIGSIVG